MITIRLIIKPVDIVNGAAAVPDMTEYEGGDVNAVLHVALY